MQEENSNTTFVREIKIDDYQKDTIDNTLVIVQSSNLQYGTGAKVWQASICLAKTLSYMQEQHIYSFKNKRVLELGCGAGLLSLFVGALGARVIATDLPIIQDLFSRNLNNNRNVVRNQVEFRQYNWNEQPDSIIQEIDYILISQAFTSEETMTLVLKVRQGVIQRLKQLLYRNKATIAFVSFKLKHHNLNQFQEKLDQLQLQGQKLEADDYHPEYYDARTIIYVIRSKSYVVLSTETFVLKIIQTKNEDKVETQQSRNDSDLEWLRRTLQTKYPGIGIPVYRINGSVQNLTKQKIIVVEEFLTFLLDHQVLKYSPEVKAFLSEKLEYLEMRKDIDDDPIQYMKQKSKYQLGSLLSVIKPWIRTRNQQSQQNRIPNMKQVMPKQSYFKTTITKMDKLIQYTKKCNQLNHSLIYSEKQTFKKCHVIQQYEKEKDRIKNQYVENQKVKENQESLEYLRLGIKMEIVKQNMASYLEWFDKIRRLQQSIYVFKQKGDYTRYNIELNYLKLLVNNMVNDMNGWTQYNNALIQDALYQL